MFLTGQVLTQALTVAAKFTWKHDYIGFCHVVMLRGINDLEHSTSFLNSIVLIQSSGCGKSCMVNEMAKLVFTILINIHNPREGECEHTVCMLYIVELTPLALFRGCISTTRQ